MVHENIWTIIVYIILCITHYITRVLHKTVMRYTTFIIMLVKFETSLKMHIEVVRYLLQIYTMAVRNSWPEWNSISNLNWAICAKILTAS